MRFVRNSVVLGTLLAISGCRHAQYVPPEAPLPPNTILLSQMMRELSAQPGFTNALVDKLDSGGKKGPALLTPKLLDELRKRILGGDWSGLDRFPGWTMREINPTVRVARHIAGKDEKLEEASAVHPGTPPAGAILHDYLDLGPYALDRAETVSLDRPSKLPGFTTEGLVTPLGAGVTRGDGPNDLAPEHAESQRLADMLNRLAANQLDDAQPFAVTVDLEDFSDAPKSPHRSAKHDPRRTATTPAELIELLQETHQVAVYDARYFANFAHLHYSAPGPSQPAHDVMAPFWIDTQHAIPGSHGRHLLIPAAHAELEWHIRSVCCKPGLNADISYYFGIDGKSEWRTMDTLDQAWVLKRNAHTYTGEQAVEATRLAGLLTVAYMHAHVAHRKLPFGGYYALGVCQDGVSAVEQALTGRVTLFPNTVDATLFSDPRDAEINRLFLMLPKDRDGHPPDLVRIFGSLPVAPAANTSDPFAEITIPGLAADLDATYAAWHSGAIGQHHSWRFNIFIALALLLLVSIRVIRGEARRRSALAESSSAEQSSSSLSS
jgi:hypothetical protein